MPLQIPEETRNTAALYYLQKSDKLPQVFRCFSSEGGVIDYWNRHPEYNKVSLVQNDPLYMAGIPCSEKRIQNSRLWSLFAGRDFNKIVNSEDTDVFSSMNVNMRTDDWQVKPAYAFSSSDAECNNIATEQFEAYRQKQVERLRNELSTNSFFRTMAKPIINKKNCSDEGADEILNTLVDCTPEYWGEEIIKTANKGASYETLCMALQSKKNIASKYDYMTFSGADGETPYRISSWNFRQIRKVLTTYVFKPFWGQVGDKLLQIRISIPAFNEKQARRILLKRLYQGSSIVFDGKVFYRKDLVNGFDDKYPYDDFSLEKGLGLHFDKLPPIETLEIEKSFDAALWASSFFPSLFYRNWKTIAFEDDTYSKFVPHPAVVDGEQYLEEIPYYGFGSTPSVFNFAFFHLFAEELGLKPDVEDYYFDRTEVLTFPPLRKWTQTECLKYVEDTENARLATINNLKEKRLAEEKRKRDEAAEAERIRKEKAELERLKGVLEKYADYKKTDITAEQEQDFIKAIKAISFKQKEIEIDEIDNPRQNKILFEHRHDKDLMAGHKDTWKCAAAYFFKNIWTLCKEKTSNGAIDFVKNNNVTIDDFVKLYINRPYPHHWTREQYLESLKLPEEHKVDRLWWVDKPKVKEREHWYRTYSYYTFDRALTKFFIFNKSNPVIADIIKRTGLTESGTEEDVSVIKVERKVSEIGIEKDEIKLTDNQRLIISMFPTCVDFDFVGELYEEMHSKNAWGKFQKFYEEFANNKGKYSTSNARNWNKDKYNLLVEIMETLTGQQFEDPYSWDNKENPLTYKKFKELAPGFFKIFDGWQKVVYGETGTGAETDIIWHSKKNFCYHEPNGKAAKFYKKWMNHNYILFQKSRDNAAREKYERLFEEEAEPFAEFHYEKWKKAKAKGEKYKPGEFLEMADCKVDKANREL